MASPQRTRLSPSDTRRRINEYTLYRFGKVLSPEDLAREAGVSKEAVEDLLGQKQISDDDLKKIAQSINVSTQLLSEIAGYQDMSEDTRRSLDEFFQAAGSQQVKPAKAA